MVTFRQSWDLENPEYGLSGPLESLADCLAHEIIHKELNHKIHKKLIEWAVDHGVPSLDSQHFSSLRLVEHDGLAFEIDTEVKSKSCAHLSPAPCSELRDGADCLILCIQKHGNRYTFAEHKFMECDHPDFRRNP